MRNLDRKVRNFPRFKGKFFTFEILISTNQEIGRKEVFLVFSQGSREATLKMLWYKLLWDNLSQEELSLFILSLTDKDYKKWAFLKAITLIPKRLARKRLLETEAKLQDKISSRSSYQGLKSVCIEIQQMTRKLPRPKKISGYVKSNSSKDKGFLGGGRVELPTPSISETDITNEDQYKIWVSLLTCLSQIPSSESVHIYRTNSISPSFSVEEVQERVLELNRQRRASRLTPRTRFLE